MFWSNDRTHQSTPDETQRAHLPPLNTTTTNKGRVTYTVNWLPPSHITTQTHTPLWSDQGEAGLGLGLNCLDREQSDTGRANTDNITHTVKPSRQYILYVLDFRSSNRYGKQTNEDFDRVRANLSLYTCHVGVEISGHHCSKNCSINFIGRCKEWNLRIQLDPTFHLHTLWTDE